MNHATRTKTAASVLALLGIAMIVIGALGPIVPPIITGVGFLLIAWWMVGNTTEG